MIGCGAIRSCTMTWLTRYGVQLLLYASDRDVAGHQVFKVSSQYRQEIKQKAKRVVEKDFLHVKVSDRGRDGKRLNAAARAEKLAKATEARIKWLKEKDTFHHGNLEMPDPNLDPVVRI